VTRDALLSLYMSGFFAAKWTKQIEHEWTTNLLANRSDLDPARLERTRQNMQRAVRDWEVLGYEPLIEALSLPDQNDRHVLAAAIRGHADCIVTSNLSDFPREYLASFDIEVLHPDDFLILQLDLDEVRALKAFKAWRMRLTTPAMTPEVFIQNIADAGLTRTSERLGKAIELL
jgi:predicted nucleic acid-binding protein